MNTFKEENNETMHISHFTRIIIDINDLDYLLKKIVIMEFEVG